MHLRYLHNAWGLKNIMESKLRRRRVSYNQSRTNRTFGPTYSEGPVKKDRLSSRNSLHTRFVSREPSQSLQRDLQIGMLHARAFIESVPSPPQMTAFLEFG